MKKTIVCLALVSLLVFGGQAIAEIGTVDDVPAATLLLPYFEVDLDNANGVTTLFSVNNASASAALVHATLWTNESIPTLDFDIYLTGYDIQTVNLRDLFNGVVPVTADDARDPSDTISPQGPKSQDISFPNCGGTLPYPHLPQSLIDHIRNSHTGKFSSVYGGCSGANYGDNVARGYITFDNVNACNLLFPSSPAYFGSAGVASQNNVLWGDFFYVDEANNFAQGEELVHIEACNNPSVGNGAGHCPFAPGDYTFYGRYVAASGDDQREPLATTFASRYVNGGPFDGGTSLVVWRDSKTTPFGGNGTHGCSGQTPSWFPLSQADIVAFDEEENCTDLCFQGDVFSPPTGGVDTCIPLESQRVSVAGGNVIGADFDPPYAFGWLYLNLNTNTTAAGGQPAYGDTAQAWVETVMSALGRFSVGYDTVALDNASTTNPGPGVVLVP